MRATVNSNKHYVQEPLTAIASGANANVLVAQSVEATLANQAFEVRSGSVIKAVYLEFWVKDDSNVQGNVLLSFLKTTDLQSPTSTDMITLHNYTNKKNVFYHTQGLTNNDTSNAIPFIRGWYKIPKGKQRMGLGDSLFVAITAQTSGQVYCGFATYKEYY